ncbi:acyl-CoA dehydrogenase [Mycobacteroides stephanolepidis]|uniref:Acyl-CoA dehydrogenase n=1 Tax=[Mycobacterium] stephanolepidis TaxID=1520670 RepID=A0A1Z4ETE0_9MYCO|nr:acyl-CoA dehydrogenase family protein [[Mycobacterium] stephanolepidis]BAX96203.1 acyl-CoA dehydrogenase [[Mycobacterium] stephanolepidis]
MRFELSDDQREVKDAARSVLVALSSPETRRAAANGQPAEELWSELRDLGWPGIAIPVAYGGEGMGLVEVAAVFEELGYACAPTPMLGTVTAAMVVAHAGTAGQRERWLPGLAGGKILGAFGITDTRMPELIADADRADVIIAIDETGQKAVVVDRVHAGIRPIEVVDSLRGYAYAGPQSDEPLDGDASGAMDRALVVVAAELVGICQASLDLTVAYAKEREQFGAPIGSFQAVGHTAAEMLRHTECARSAVYYAAWAAEHNPGELPLAASMAKAAASDAGRAVTAAAVQMHGAYGFSWEAEVHWYYARAVMDAQLFGDAAFHRARIAKLVADGRNPACPNP